MLRFLNANSAALIAIAALVTATATIVLAWFSAGTWKLYRLERRRTETTAVRITESAGRLSGAFETLLHVQYTAWIRAPSKPDRTSWDVFLYFVEEVTKAAANEIPDLIRIAERGEPEALSTLMLVRDRVGVVSRWLPELRDHLYLRTSDDPDRIVNIDELEHLVDALGEIADDLQKIPGIPRRSRVHEQLDLLFPRLREMPSTHARDLEPPSAET